MSFLSKKFTFQKTVIQLVADMRQCFSDMRQPFFASEVDSCKNSEA